MSDARGGEYGQIFVYEHYWALIVGDSEKLARARCLVAELVSQPGSQNSGLKEASMRLALLVKARGVKVVMVMVSKRMFGREF